MPAPQQEVVRLQVRRVPFNQRLAGGQLHLQSLHDGAGDLVLDRKDVDRSENGDYIYGKRKLREIDRRIRYLSKALDRAVVVDNSGKTHQRVHFGATVTILPESGDEREVTIVGVDELDAGDARVSWRSPLARALLSAKVGDTVTVHAPRGPEEIEIVAVRYDDLR